MKNKIIVVITSCLLILVTLVACATTNSDSSESSEGTEPVGVYINTTELNETRKTITESNKTRITTTESNESKTAKSTPVLSTIDIDSIEQYEGAELVPNFNYSDFNMNDNCYIQLVRVVDDVVFFEKYIKKSYDTSDVYYYSYDLSTGKYDQFDGCIHDFNASVGSYAFVGDSIFFTIETVKEQVHYKVNLREKKICILKTVPLNRDTDSFVYTYALNDTSYIESHYNIDKDSLIYHVTLFTPTSEREIINKTGDRSDVIYTYSASAGMIYEYSQRNHLSESYISTFDASGNLLSSNYLQEVTNAIQNESSNYLDHFVVFNNYLAYNIGGKMPRDNCILYDMTKNTVTQMGDIRFSLHSQGNETNGIQTMITHSKTGDPAMMELCYIDKSGDLKKIASRLDDSFSVASSNTVIVFIKNKKMYKFSFH